MKTEISNKPQFNPVSVTLTFETQEELDAFGALSNSSVIREALNDIGGEQPSYHIFEAAGASLSTGALNSALNSALKKHAL